VADEVDVVVVGMAVGGEEVAGRLAAAGLSVVGIEHRLVGGECPYWGCVPSKMMIRAANALAEARRIPGLAGLATVEPDWSPVAKRIREEATDDWDDKIAVDRFVKKGGRFVRGFGRLAGPGRVEGDGQQFALVLDDGQRLVAERLLVAPGRRADLGELGLSSVGLPDDARFLEVDEWLRAGERLWGVGDVTGKGAFTHVAMYHADIVVRDILGQGGPAADHRALPRVTFTDPEIGAVGLTEARARERGGPVRTGYTDLITSARGWIHKAGNEGFIKLVAAADRHLLGGATAAGPSGGEALSRLAVAVHAAVPVATLRSMMYAYPTFHPAIEDALKDLSAEK